MIILDTLVIFWEGGIVSPIRKESEFFKAVFNLTYDLELAHIISHRKILSSRRSHRKYVLEHLDQSNDKSTEAIYYDLKNVIK